MTNLRQVELADEIVIEYNCLKCDEVFASSIEMWKHFKTHERKSWTNIVYSRNHNNAQNTSSIQENVQLFERLVKPPNFQKNVTLFDSPIKQNKQCTGKNVFQFFSRLDDNQTGGNEVAVNGFAEKKLNSSINGVTMAKNHSVPINQTFHKTVKDISSKESKNQFKHDSEMNETFRYPKNIDAPENHKSINEFDEEKVIYDSSSEPEKQKNRNDKDEEVELSKIPESEKKRIAASIKSKESSNQNNRDKESIEEPNICNEPSENQSSKKFSIECEKCGKKLKFQRSLLDHIAKHHPERTSSTIERKKSSKNAAADSLEVYEKTKYDSNIYKCKKCFYTSRYPSKIINHQYVHSSLYECEDSFKPAKSSKDYRSERSGDRSFKCFECKKFFKTAATLKEHKKIHSDDKVYKCGECDYASNSSYNLKAHRLVHSDDRPFQCATCKKCFKRASTLKNHELVHSKSSNIFKCDQCDYSSNFVYKLKIHQAVHSEDRNYECSECTKRFKTVDYLKKHQKTHTDKIYKCKKCDFVSKTEQSLRLHQKVHLETYECNECSKRFKSAKYLKKHQKTHTDKIYECESCDYATKTEQSLKFHQKMHSMDRPYECIECSKRFKSAESLRRHQRSHSDKIYKCESCEYAAKTKKGLRDHQAVHTENRPFECSQCKKCFKTRVSLRNHKKIHSRSTSTLFKCKICEYTTKLDFEFIEHQILHN